MDQKEITNLIERAWPLTEHYEYSAEVGMILRTTNPGWWAEFEQQRGIPALSPQAAGFSFLEFLESSIEKEQDYLLLLEEITKAILKSATRLKVELQATINFLKSDIKRLKTNESGLAPEIFPQKNVIAIKSMNTVSQRDDIDGFADKILKNYLINQLPEISEKDLFKTHSKFYIDGIKDAEERFGGAWLTPETKIEKGSLKASLASAGAILGAGEEVIKVFNESRIPSLALCSVQSWSHHAEQSRGLGTCIVNNIAVASNTLINRGKTRVKKVAILDLDAHHGNGFQEIFYKNPDVLTVSIHQQPPFFPGTGSSLHRGEGPGLNLNLNIEVNAGDSWFEKLKPGLLKIKRFNPDIIFVELSGDAMESDPISVLKSSEQDFFKVGNYLKEIKKPVVAEIGAATNFYSLASAVSGFVSGWSSS